MKTLLLIGAMFACSSCAVGAVAAGALIDVGIHSAMRAAAAERANDPELERDAEKRRIARLADQSRGRLYDPVTGPRCAVSVTHTGPRTWSLSSCDGALKCWAAGVGYDCERPPAAAPVQL